MPKLTLLVASALLLAACGSAGPSAPTQSSAAGVAAQPAPPDSPVTLSVWDGSTTIQAPLYIAMDRGYLQEQGIEVQAMPITGAFDAQVPLLATGQLDVGGGSIVPALFNAVGRGLPLRVTAIGALHTPGRSQLIVARKDLVESGQLKSYADLRGKVVGRPTALGIATIAIEKALELGGLTSSDITYLDLPTPDTVVALGNNKVDVAYMTEPFGTQAIEQGVAVKWHEMADLVPNHVAAMWAYGSKLLDEQPEVGRRFMVALMHGMRDYEDAFGKNKGRADVVNILVKHTVIKEPALYEKMQIIAEPASGEFPLDTLQEDYDWLKARGAIQEPAPALSQVVDTRFVQDALQQLGPYQ
ncbi:MAG TPA: ABC transporter substrate-binding protein [Chloroflexota bacterium]|nr:ABC transporter substrate-binding protein [Chloroflexota bacterium]